jgi:hypothetical protein
VNTVKSDIVLRLKLDLRVLEYLYFPYNSNESSSNNHISSRIIIHLSIDGALPLISKSQAVLRLRETDFADHS